MEQNGHTRPLCSASRALRTVIRAVCCYAHTMAEVQHYVGGKPAMTIWGLAARYGIDSYETMQIGRAHV